MRATRPRPRAPSNAKMPLPKKGRGIFAELLGRPVKHSLPAGVLASPRGKTVQPKDARGQASEERPREVARETRRQPVEREPEPLQSFQLPPPVLGAPLQGGGAPPAGSGVERAQAAALAERLLTSVRVGEVAGGHEVRLSFRGVEVRLREVDGVLTPTLRSDSGADLRGLAERVSEELEAAGLRFEAVEVEP